MRLSKGLPRRKAAGAVVAMITMATVVTSDAVATVASTAAMLVRLFIQERSELNEQSRTPCPTGTGGLSADRQGFLKSTT